jgi:hypothetical protein
MPGRLGSVTGRGGVFVVVTSFWFQIARVMRRDLAAMSEPADKSGPQMSMLPVRPSAWPQDAPRRAA